MLTAPTAPLISAGPTDEVQPREGLGPARDGLGAAYLLRHAATKVRVQHDVGVDPSRTRGCTTMTPENKKM
jgi:hypothetical protein